MCSGCSERLRARLPPGHHEEGVASVEAEAAGALPPPARRGQAPPRELRQQPLRGSLALLLPVPGTMIVIVTRDGNKPSPISAFTFKTLLRQYTKLVLIHGK